MSIEQRIILNCLLDNLKGNYRPKMLVLSLIFELMIQENYKNNLNRKRIVIKDSSFQFHKKILVVLDTIKTT